MHFASTAAAAAEAMLVVVDVVDASSTDTTTRDGEGQIERLEIDVEVTPHTTADELLADVEAALTEMACTLCVPRSTAALAPGNALPPLTVLASAMRTATAEKSSWNISSGNSGGEVAARYAAALRREKATVTFPLGACRIGSAHVRRAAPTPSFPSSAVGTPETISEPHVWSVVPRSLVEHASVFPPPPAVTLTASSRMLERKETAASGGGALSTQDGSDTAAHGKPLPPAATTAAAAVAAPPITPGAAATTSAPPPKTPVVALGDVNVPAFRRLEAHRALVLAREEAAFGATCTSTTAGALTSAEEHLRLQPPLPWAAVEAAIAAEVCRLQSEQVLMGGCGSISQHDVRGGAGSGAAAVVSPFTAPFADLGTTRARLRAAWLQAVKNEMNAYETATLELRQAAERAEVWRAAVKEALRGEIKELEGEASRQESALTERDVLRRRVEQLQAQVGAAKAVEKALLQSSAAAPTNHTTSAIDATTTTATVSSAEGKRDEEDEALLSSSAPTSSISSSDSDLPPLPTPLADNDPPPPSSSWRGGRRVPLTHPHVTPPRAAAAAVVAAAEARSRSRLSIERSFLSPALQQEVRAALSSDDNGGTGTSCSSASESATPVVQRGRADVTATQGVAVRRGRQEGEVVSQPPQQIERRRRYQRRGTSGSWEGPTAVEKDEGRTAAAAAHSLRRYASTRGGGPPPVTPLRTAHTTAPSSPPPVVPPENFLIGPRSRHRHYENNADVRYDADAPPHSREREVSTSVPSPPFSRLFDKSNSFTTHRSDDAAPREAGGRRHVSPAADVPASAGLRSVTEALRRHIRKQRPDPAEGQRLLQQVRELRREIEREEETAEVREQVGRRGSGGAGSVNTADPQNAVSISNARRPFASSSQLYDSRLPSRRKSGYRY